MEVFDEKTSIFNPFTVEDFTSFQSDQKAAMEERPCPAGFWRRLAPKPSPA